MAAALAALQKAGALVVGALARPLSGSAGAAAAARPAPRAAAADVEAETALTREAKYFLLSIVEVCLWHQLAIRSAHLQSFHELAEKSSHARPITRFLGPWPAKAAIRSGLQCSVWLWAGPIAATDGLLSAFTCATFAAQGLRGLQQAVDTVAPVYAAARDAVWDAATTPVSGTAAAAAAAGSGPAAEARSGRPPPIADLGLGAWLQAEVGKSADGVKHVRNCDDSHACTRPAGLTSRPTLPVLTQTKSISQRSGLRDVIKWRGASTGSGSMFYAMRRCCVVFLTHPEHPAC